ncbi:Gfo/Idh/MocA family oxidoreductase [Diplocloster hominis]|uniref:Gfo/Idh/MocA family protein n=1 Tax=Diplocloster hominis TaxID=3079010 RepID=UPI0031BABEE4
MAGKQERKIRMVLVGYGGMGRQYAERMTDGGIEGLTLTGICCRNQDGQQEISSRYPNVQIYKNTDHMFDHAGEFDGLLIATPHRTHVTLGIRAFQHGLHVLAEKPLGVSTMEARQFIDAHRQASVAENRIRPAFAVMFNLRMLPAWIQAHRMIREGCLGNLTSALWIRNDWYRSPCYHQSSPWRCSWTGEGGGLLINQCQHDLDLWQWLFGMPQSIRADIGYGRFHSFSVDDSVELKFHYAADFKGNYLASSGESPGVNRLEIWGTKGRLTLENNAVLTFDENEVATDEFARSNREIYGKPAHRCRRIPVEETADTYRLMLQNFADHIRYGNVLAVPGEEGLNALELANAAYLSSWFQEEISIPIDDGVYQNALAAQMRLEKPLP